jgi:hypothetical protein
LIVLASSIEPPFLPPTPAIQSFNSAGSNANPAGGTLKRSNLIFSSPGANFFTTAATIVSDKNLLHHQLAPSPDAVSKKQRLATYASDGGLAEDSNSSSSPQQQNSPMMDAPNSVAVAGNNGLSQSMDSVNTAQAEEEVSTISKIFTFLVVLFCKSSELYIKNIQFNFHKF